MPVIKTFLSYSSTETEEARRLKRELEARGIGVWIDHDRIEVGEVLPEALRVAIADSDYVLVMVSPSAVTSDWVTQEIRLGLERELSLKRTVVIPVVVKPSSHPLLEHRIHLDLTLDESRRAELDRLVRKLRGEPIQDRETEDVLGEVERFKFSQLWRQAIDIGQFSRRIRSIIREALATMVPGTESWSPVVTSSYLLLLRELGRHQAPCNGASALLREVVEDRRIAGFLRRGSLTTLLLRCPPDPSAEPAPLDIFGPDEDPAFAAPLLERCLGVVAAEPEGHDPSDGITVMAELLSGSDTELRQRLLLGLRERLASHDLPVSLLRDLELVDGDRDAIVEALIALRDRASEMTRPVREGPLEVRRARAILESLTSGEGRNAVALEEVIDVFRQASRGEQNGDFALYAEAFEAVSPQSIPVIRRLRGESYLFSLLAGVICDPEVEVTLAALTCQLLMTEFGDEALLFDDRLVESLFVPKEVGQHRVSVIDGLCDSAGLPGEDLSSIALLAAISQVASPRRSTELRTRVGKGSAANLRLSCLDRYLDGKLSVEELESCCQRRTAGWRERG